jgi:death-on-curing protein
LAIHDRSLAAHGGTAGLRDRGLLQSALARAQQHYAYAEGTDIIEMAALYTAGVVRNHPFVDGNKRSGFMAGVLFLEMNGYDFAATEEDVIGSVLALAAGEMDEAGYTVWLRANVKSTRKR